MEEIIKNVILYYSYKNLNSADMKNTFVSNAPKTFFLSSLQTSLGLLVTSFFFKKNEQYTIKQLL